MISTVEGADPSADPSVLGPTLEQESVARVASRRASRRSRPRPPARRLRPGRPASTERGEDVALVLPEVSTAAMGVFLAELAAGRAGRDPRRPRPGRGRLAR